MNIQPNKIRSAIHKVRKDRKIKLLQLYGRLTSKNRMLPEFLIIGSQRAGTTSLYNYLAGHPNIRRAIVKEVHFFDNHFQKGFEWYRGHFPVQAPANGERRTITGEATPYYIFHPHAAQRIAALFPSVKIIVLLRNPVDRAYSHYQHEVKLGYETLSFEEAVDQENTRLAGELDRFSADESYRSFKHQHFSYLSRGIYVDQLKHWLKFFPRDQFLVIKSEDLFQSRQEIFSQVLEFLDLPAWSLPKTRVHNQLQYQEMSASTRERFGAYFEPYNQELYSFLERDFGWEREYRNAGSGERRSQP